VRVSANLQCVSASVLVLEMSFLCSVIECSLSEIVDVGILILT